MRIAIIINKQRYNAPQLNEKLLHELAAKHDLSCDLIIPEANEIASSIQLCLSQSYNGIVIGGGDGTIRTAAQELVGKELPLAVLPLGSFNYFAKEMEYPPDLDSLLALIKNNKTKLIDVGNVNDYTFINHASVGFYSRIMKMRKKYPQLLGRNRLLKMLFTGMNFFKDIPLYRLTLKIDGKEMTQKTYFIMVGNNHHSTDMFKVGKSVTFTMGLLEVLVLRCESRWELIKSFFITLLVGNDRNKYIEKYITDNLMIDSPAEKIDVVLDGDLYKLDIPLQYSVDHKQLMVFIP